HPAVQEAGRYGSSGQEVFYLVGTVPFLSEKKDWCAVQKSDRCMRKQTGQVKWQERFRRPPNERRGQREDPVLHIKGRRSQERLKAFYCHPVPAVWKKCHCKRLRPESRRW